VRQGLAIIAVVVALAAGAFYGALQLLDSTEVDPLVAPTEALQAYADAWTQWDLGAMEALVRQPPASFRPLHAALLETVQPSDTRVSPGSIVLEGNRAEADVVVAVGVPDAGTWEWVTHVTLERGGGVWQVVWQPSTLHPELRAGDTFASVVEEVERSPILDRQGVALTSPGTIYEIGIEPGRLPEREEWEAVFAAILPEAIEAIDKTLAKPNVNPGWYYPVITIGQERFDLAWDTLRPVPGVIRKTAEARVGTDEGFGLHVLGRMRTIDEAEAIELGPVYAEGDEIGAYGLEAALEDELKGSPRLQLFVRQADGDLDEVLYEYQGDPSRPVATTLDVDVQESIENALRGVEGNVAIVAVDPATGGVLGAASRPLDGYDRALEGKYPPGSTFKIVTAAAALSAGIVDPQTTVACPAETIVGGLRVRNAGGFDLGEVTFAEAFARSCNTTFAKLAEQLSDEDLERAAASFGFALEGEDPAGQLALASFTGSFPTSTDLAERAAASFGQARVEASALHLATVAAAVIDGAWRPPRLLEEDPAGTSRPLEAGVPIVLRELMALAVSDGTGTAARAEGLTVGGKTGSAEFGEGDPKPSHAWFVGYATGGQGAAANVAFAVLVEDGGSGSEVAAPIAGRFLAELAAQTARSAREAAEGG